MTTDLPPLPERVAAPAVAPVPDPSTGLTWRPLAADDVEGLTVLVQAIETADRAPLRTSKEELQERLAEDGIDVRLDTLAGVDGQGVLRAWALVDQPAGDTRVVRAFLSGGVDPAWRRRGIGRQVLEWSVARGRQRIVATGKQVPARIGVFVDDNATATVALLDAAGLTPIRYYAEMRRPLDGELPVPRGAAGIRVVPWSTELDEQMRLAHNEAFADHWGSEPRTATQWAEGRAMFAPTWSFAAVDEASGEVAGYLLSGRYEQDWPVNGYRSGYTELLGVRPAWRGRGVAVDLLVAAMLAYRADGMEYAELGVDTENESGAHGLYARLGYVVYHQATLRTIEL
ncbi:GNAT family N-acetyltransferase [Cellulomonas edaphi]|uniref:GNAT family N-acetyltransferase n=1 Tax=Cellulomonas edaphi TaxID=3053468 RepID=A0ABT7S6Z7_9CELL|nr:GNAT family N-acetyltransferase [Cellulomons edaphi]MDM7831387.1 GNAT family N-acetyltransferase [Cellulomons edaphi]